jgi:nodulation protein E
MRRVAVTGIGVVSAIGLTREVFWRALCDGRSGIAPLEGIDSSKLKFSNAAQVRGFDPCDFMTAKESDQVDRFVHLSAAATAEAIADSGRTFSGENVAVVTGTSCGGNDTENQAYHELYALLKTRLNPLTIPRIMANAACSWISMRYGITGPGYTVSTACASSNHAIGQAFHMVRNGMAEAALAGGSEAPFSFGLLKAWEAMRVVSPDTCRPFSTGRSGLILAEGAAMLTLEAYDSAVARGAHIYAEIRGFGMSCDASHVTAPSAAGAERAMRLALRDAALVPEQIGYINAHGTGTPMNDTTEALAIRQVFVVPPPVSSTKSMHGHALGAAGALEAAATLLALDRGVLPPTMNVIAPDPECGLDIIAGEARVHPVQAALSNSFAFGGLNAVLAFRK